MLRNFVCGYRDFRKLPDIAAVRYNWIILISFDGKLQPQIDPPLMECEKTDGANFFVIPPQTRYVLVPKKPRCYRAVFHFAWVGGALHSEVVKRGIFRKQLDGEGLKEVQSIGEMVKGHFRSKNILSELYFELAAQRLAILALCDLDFEPLNPLYNVPHERVRKALAWYGENLSKSPSLATVADSVHISASHLRRHFYEQMGDSPKAIFSKLRMQRAAQLLISTSFTLDQIAVQCGFRGATEFCRAFKKVFKVTPNHWRHNENESGQVDLSFVSERECQHVAAVPVAPFSTSEQRGRIGL